ncbi:MAG: hypothetical protein JSV96_16175 [Candidatus Aminicenantes bacterium]|nr:MAG: hypothetical protein JSV96_16175 [Candidatus Aminicenantes bacterium]
MNKKLLISAFFFFFVFSLNLLPQEESKEKKIWEDERISITVDKVERADSFPERLRNSYTTYHQPEKGHDFVLIHISLDEKKDLRIKASELRNLRPKSPHLIDDRDKTHWMSFAQYNITIRAKKTGYLVFEMPKEATPVKLKYIYQYREEPPKSKKIKYGQIDIDLSHIQ